MNNYALRPYQQEAVQKIHDEWYVNGHKHTLLTLPTGTGKTITFAKVTQDEIQDGSRALILAHREELLGQAQDKLYKAFGIESALEKGEKSAIGAQVIVGSVQTMKNRLDVYSPDYFKTIVVDEAHHVPSPMYQSVLTHFETANVLGVTATPDRGDKKKLGDRDLPFHFDSEAFSYSMRKAVKEGYLCKLSAQMIPLNIDLTKVKTIMGDYSENALGDALDPYLEQIAIEMKSRCEGRKTLVFLPLIATSQKFRDILADMGMRVAEVNGESPDRAEKLADFESGRYDVLCNAMLLTEGWDCPPVDCIVVLRPTKIRSLYQQMVGRGMRPFPGKENLLLLDFLWMTAKHDLCHSSGLIADTEEKAKAMEMKIAKDNQIHDLFDVEEEVEQDAKAAREKTVADELAKQRHKKTRLVDPLQFAYSIADTDISEYEPVWPWESDPATEKQREILERRGIDISGNITKGYASRLLDRLFARQDEGLSTPKQIKTLERFGFVNVGTWSFSQANQWIGKLADRGWTLPYNFDPSKVEAL